MYTSDEVITKFIQSLPENAPEYLKQRSEWKRHGGFGYASRIQDVVAYLADKHIIVTWPKECSWSEEVSALDSGIKIANFLHIPESALRSTNMLECEVFYGYVYRTLLEQTAIVLDGLPPTDKRYDEAMRKACTYQVQDVQEVFARKVFDGCLIRAIDYCLYKDGVLWFVVAGKEQQVILDDLWQEYANTPVLYVCSAKEFDSWLRLRLAMSAIPLNTVVRKDVPDEVKDRLLQCTPVQSVSVCLGAFQRTGNLSFFTLALQYVCVSDIDVPWICITSDMDTKDIYSLLSKSPYCEELESIYKDKGMEEVVQKILRVASCMPTSTWSADYAEAFKNTWKIFHNQEVKSDK